MARQRSKVGKTQRASGKAQAFIASAQDSMETNLKKKEHLRKRMRVVQLQRSVDRQEQELRNRPTVAPPAKKPPRKGPTPPEEWKLKGAARPWKMLVRIENGELDERGDEIKKPVETYDFFTKALKDGTFNKHKETVEYLKTLRQLAAACCEAGMGDRGIKHYERCMELDKEDVVRSREGLVCALIDDGRGDEARELLDKCEGKDSPVLAYCRVILEYVSWEVLEEEGSSEEVVREAFLKAFKLNPYIAVFIVAHETFFQVVEYVEDIKEANIGSIEECFQYCSQNIGVWMDTVGACAWIEKEMAELPEPLATDQDCSDEMYLGMYQTAVEMYKEQQQEEAESEEEEGDDGDEDNAGDED
ncbi:TPA: LOW QUALITY PROTEIN: hypothetical protein N0F65_011244 [Lagenidium giganteum]|uniref:Uncharacterized protein n=1 Tax=Lagenidium giganteum TaxID=4803 RepID=A0AAV2Z076_9STRA|nr:TPA: LOW QUALITY PROTEIN: hypothetical protein N0F65_011244 [Lagenidium giganteum]